jgi:hypothetical protein
VQHHHISRVVFWNGNLNHESDSPFFSWPETKAMNCSLFVYYVKHIYFLRDRACTSTFNSLFSSFFFLVESLAYMFYKWYWFAFFIQHKDPVWSSDAEPPFGSRKRNEKAYARSAKKYHQDKIRSGLFPFPFLLFIIFSQLAIVQCDFLASHKRMDSWLHEMIR